VPAGTWVAPGGARLGATELAARLARESVVLLGESHDNPEHHRWQLQVIAALHAQRPDMALAFEMFPRRAQPALDRWVAGKLTEREFLREADWSRAWSFDAQLYLPIFHFARMNRIPMLAVNVDRALTRAVAEEGFDGVAEDRREGITRPAAPTPAYLESLLPVWREHAHARGGKDAPDADVRDPLFLRFVESQQVWDRALAQGIAAAATRAPAPLLVGVMGMGHVAQGWGVPHQLRDLGVTRVAVLLPWDRGSDCSRLVPGYADAVFGLDPPEPPAPRPRLGIWLEAVPEGIRLLSVDAGSIAEAAGLRSGDVIVEAAGVPVRATGELAGIVQRQTPGAWLPLAVARDGERLEIVAKFPSQKP
jgi:uncharacterized iron-regulated protein